MYDINDQLMLDGIGQDQEVNISKFFSLWKKVKNVINELIDLPSKIIKAKRKAKELINRGYKVSVGQDVIANIKNSDQQFKKIYPTSVEVRKRIIKYLPQWKRQEEKYPETESGFFYSPGSWLDDVETDDNNLGIVTAIILTVAAMAALSFVAVKGLQVLKEYKYEQRVLEAAEKKIYSLEEAKGLIREGRSGSIIGDFMAGKVIDAISPIVVILGLIGIGYVYYLKKR